MAGFFGGLDRVKLGCVAVSLAVMGVFSLVCGGMAAWQSFAFTFDSERAEGVVLRHEEQAPSDPEDRPTYAPVVRYTRQDGRTVEFTSGFSSNPRQHEPGERVTVVYRPASGEAEIWSFMLWLFPAISLVGAAGFFGLAGLLLWLAVR